MERVITIEAPDDVRTVLQDNARLNGEIAAAHVLTKGLEAELRRRRRADVRAVRRALRDGLWWGFFVGAVVAYFLILTLIEWTS